MEYGLNKETRLVCTAVAARCVCCVPFIATVRTPCRNILTYFTGGPCNNSHYLGHVKMFMMMIMMMLMMKWQVERRVTSGTGRFRRRRCAPAESARRWATLAPLGTSIRAGGVDLDGAHQPPRDTARYRDGTWTRSACDSAACWETGTDTQRPSRCRPPS